MATTTNAIRVTLEGYPVRWQTGREIVSVRVVLGQGEKASHCEVTLADPTGTIAESLIRHTLETGGLQALPSPQQPRPGSDANAIQPGGSIGVNPTGQSPPNRAAWEAAIVQECIRQGVQDRNQIAYILATAYHESDKFLTLEEYSSGDQYEGREDLGNTQPGDGRRFKG